jgi:hypothetical protein
MPKSKAAPNFNPMLEETGDALTDEEKAAAAAEERGEPAVQAVPDAEETEPAEQTAEPAETAEGGKKGKKPSVVPYDRFSEVVDERNRTRIELEQIRKEASESRERWARLEERQKLANDAQTRAQQAAAAAERAAQRPDPDVDPAGARAWDAVEDAKAARAEVARLTEFVNGRSQELQGWTQQQQMQGYVQQIANTGRSRHPDWDARVDFARGERTKLWMSLGHSEENARKIVANEEYALVASAAQNGADLVTTVANMTTQWGYKPTNGKVNGNGNVKLDQIAAGQRVQGQGRVQSAQEPAQQPWQQMDDQAFAMHIANMDDADYLEAIKDKNFNKKVLALDVR